ncbi:hypothetical protein GCM10023219_22910 [Stakelama sediminis]|uniref:Uncharacterized protein n=1 Tax=Stakelama sediminis TaxID=463200 RepID=A0A840Z0J1_9SPHN|nr:hypothetical protein [Stakelama sediminis]MBB5719246.1 hypothetical protein [Stakelama sediminis]
MSDSSSDSELIAEELIELEEDTGGAQESLAELKKRCEAAKIEIRTRSFEDDGVTYTSVGLPSGRAKRWVGATGDRLERLLQVPFEKFVFLQGFEAICSYEDGFIEAGVRGIPVSTMAILRRMARLTGKEAEDYEFVLEPGDEAQGRPTYRIGNSSDEFAALVQLPGSFGRPTLRLENLSVSCHEQALDILNKYANGLLFQMDLAFDASFMLERERVRRFRPISRKVRAIELQYPTAEYDDAPLSLYWYARSARSMPLLQFLAFYQCIEFFFPTFSKAEARRKIALLLKDPTFRADRDSDVARLLSAISVSRSGGIGDERSQLRATVNECLNAEELRTFFDEDEDRSAFFRGKPKSGIHRIPLSNEGADLRNDVADRIYNFRCRIVHTKDGENQSGEMILPFSEEAGFLIFDIELAQFVARKVLIATSSLLA